MFERIAGQENAVNVLSSMVVSGEIPHVLLFAGPYGVGKGETAFELARMLLCENGPESGCTTCGACYRASKLEHPDLHVLFPFRAMPQSADKHASWTDELIKHRKLLSDEPYAPVMYEKSRQIVKSLVNAVHDRLLESSFEGGRKVCIILSADKLNKTTGNSLLKILEEPPDSVNFILTTERLSSVLPTITSRSSVLRFRRLRENEIQSYLNANRELEPEKIVSYSRVAGGSIKTAKAHAFENKAELLAKSYELYEAAAICKREEAVSYAYNFLWSRDIIEAEELINGFAMRTKQVLENKLGITGDNDTFPEILNSLCNNTNISYLNRLSVKLEDGLEMLGRNVNISTVMTSIFYGINDAFRQKQQQ